MSETTNVASRGATMAVDWEQRIDFDRLRAHRLARTKRTEAATDPGGGKLVRDELVV